MIAAAVLSSCLLVSNAEGEVKVTGGSVLLGKTRVVVLDDPAGAFDDTVSVRFDPVVSVSDVVLHDGDLHCVVTGVSSGSGAIEIRSGDGFERVDPGIVCFRDAAELGAILDALFAQEVRDLGPPAAGPLAGARGLLGQLLQQAPNLNGTAAGALARAIDRQIARASILANADLAFLQELVSIYLTLLYRQGPGGVCWFEDDPNEVTAIPALQLSHDVSDQTGGAIWEDVQEIAGTFDPGKLLDRATDVPAGKGNEERDSGGFAYHLASPGMVLGMGNGPAVFGFSNASSNEIDFQIGDSRFKTPEALLRTTRAKGDSNSPIEVTFGDVAPLPGFEYKLTVHVKATDFNVHVRWGAVVYAEIFSTTSIREPAQLLDSWGVAPRLRKDIQARMSSNMIARNRGVIRTSLNGSTASLSQIAQARLDVRVGEVFADERVILDLPRVRQVMEVGGRETFRGTESKDLVVLDIDSALRATVFSRDWALGMVETGSMVWVVPWAICRSETEEGPVADAWFPRQAWHLGLLGRSGAKFKGEAKRFFDKQYLALQDQVFTFTHDMEKLDGLIEEWEVEQNKEIVAGLKDLRSGLRADQEAGQEPGGITPQGLDNDDLRRRVESIHEEVMKLFHDEYQEYLERETLTGEGP